MKKHRVALLSLLAGLAIIALMNGGCQEEDDDFFSSPSEPPQEPLPGQLIGTWYARYAVINGQQLTVAEAMASETFPAYGARIQFAENGQCEYMVSDAGGKRILGIQGTAVIHEGQFIWARQAVWNGETGTYEPSLFFEARWSSESPEIISQFVYIGAVPL